MLQSFSPIPSFTLKFFFIWDREIKYKQLGNSLVFFVACSLVQGSHSELQAPVMLTVVHACKQWQIGFCPRNIELAKQKKKKRSCLLIVHLHSTDLSSLLNVGLAPTAGSCSMLPHGYALYCLFAELHPSISAGICPPLVCGVMHVSYRNERNAPELCKDQQLATWWRPSLKGRCGSRWCSTEPAPPSCWCLYSYGVVWCRGLHAH